jgi:hypothetical protein
MKDRENRESGDQDTRISGKQEMNDKTNVEFGMWLTALYYARFGACRQAGA